jgi:hypothetical protein
MIHNHKLQASICGSNSAGAVPTCMRNTHAFGSGFETQDGRSYILFELFEVSSSVYFPDAGYILRFMWSSFLACGLSVGSATETHSASSSGSSVHTKVVISCVYLIMDISQRRRCILMASIVGASEREENRSWGCDRSPREGAVVVSRSPVRFQIRSCLCIACRFSKAVGCDWGPISKNV